MNLDRPESTQLPGVRGGVLLLVLMSLLAMSCAQEADTGAAARSPDPSPQVNGDRESLTLPPAPTSVRCDELPPEPADPHVTVYFICDEAGVVGGELRPAFRDADPQGARAEVDAAVSSLVGGPTETESALGMYTPLPDEARSAPVRSDLRDGTAWVEIEFDFSRVNNLSTSAPSGAFLSMLYGTLLEIEAVEHFDLSGVCERGLGDIHCGALSRASMEESVAQHTPR